MPQWNCGCHNCSEARIGGIPRSLQSSVAVRDDNGYWFLINASPDLSAQISACPDLHPKPGALRHSPIAGVLLTDADLDHVLGLFSLREGSRLHIHTSREIREVLDKSLGLTAVLNSFCGVYWHESSHDAYLPLPGPGQDPSSLSYRMIKLPGGPPLFAGGEKRDGDYNLACCILDRQTGGRLLVAPGVASGNEALLDAMHTSDAILFDGTFWSSNELSQVRPGARTAEQMGHLPVRDQSLQLLKTLSAARRIYIHINNTNPILRAGSPEQAAVAAAGVVVGYDGLEFDL